MESAVSFPFAPLIDAETRSPTLTPLILVTLPVTLVARVTVAVISWPPPFSVMEVALTAVTWPPISSRSIAPGGSDGRPPCGAGRVPLPAPLVPVFGGTAPGDAVALELGAAPALAGPAASCSATTTTPKPKTAATTAVSASSQPRLAAPPPQGPLRCHPPGGSPRAPEYSAPGGNPGAGQWGPGPSS